MKKQAEQKKNPLGIPTSDPPVPNRAHTEMKLPAKEETKKGEGKKA